MRVDEVQALSAKIVDEVGKVVVGKRAIVERAIKGIGAGSNVVAELVEVGKIGADRVGGITALSFQVLRKTAYGGIGGGVHGKNLSPAGPVGESGSPRKMSARITRLRRAVLLRTRIGVTGISEPKACFWI